MHGSLWRPQEKKKKKKKKGGTTFNREGEREICVRVYIVTTELGTYLFIIHYLLSIELIFLPFGIDCAILVLLWGAVERTKKRGFYCHWLPSVCHIWNKVTNKDVDIFNGWIHFHCWEKKKRERGSHILTIVVDHIEQFHNEVEGKKNRCTSTFPFNTMERWKLQRSIHLIEFAFLWLIKFIIEEEEEKEI